MKIIHSINNYNIEKDIDDKENVGFLLTNGLGGYAAFAKENDSRYNGWFASFGHKVYKIIDEIKIQNAAKIVKIKNEFYQTERSYDNGLTENVFVPRQYNSLVYEFNKETAVEVVLDIRESYDGRNFGRNYEITEENGLTIVKYTKHKNWEEDRGEGKEYEIFLAIKTDSGDVEKIGQWLEKHYNYDEKRASYPFDRHVYKALAIKAGKIVIASSLDKKTAKAQATFVFRNTSIFKANGKKRAAKFFKRAKISDKNLIVSLAAAKNSLANLLVQDEKKFGLYAGLPWFFYFWTSDEAICLKSVSEIDKELAKKIILRDIAYINDDGKTYDVAYAKILHQYSLNMDAAGWLFKRASEMPGKGILGKEEVKRKLIAVIENLRKNYMRDGFIYSETGETWMDTFYAKDVRDGARIEIQALMLSMYKTAYEITLEEKYKAWEKELCENVLKFFWNGDILADGLNDFTIRPNGFIAYYIYPDLLTKKEWIGFFKKVLSSLWLGWGGVSTIDITSPYFYNEYTGEVPESYHRGDSWYWINNLVALVLNRLDAETFKEYISKILKASSESLLWHGFLGHLPELSSAKEQRSEGAWAQGWSAAMYIEAMEEITRSSRKNLKPLLEKTGSLIVVLFSVSAFFSMIMYAGDIQKNQQAIIQPGMLVSSMVSGVSDLPETLTQGSAMIYDMKDAGLATDPCTKESEARNSQAQEKIGEFYNDLINKNYARAVLEYDAVGYLFPICASAHAALAAVPRQNGIILFVYSGNGVSSASNRNYFFGFLTASGNKIILSEQMINHYYDGLLGDKYRNILSGDISSDEYSGFAEISNQLEERMINGITSGIFADENLQSEYNRFVARFN